MKTICCQLGAREHYAVPRALDATECLHSLITDAWIGPESVFSKLPVHRIRRLAERYHPALANANVRAFTSSLLGFEFKQTLLHRAGWSRIMARNDWFQSKAQKVLEKPTQDRMTLFTYSYAGLKLLRYARKRNWRTVLGQIDAGPVADEIIKTEYAKNPGLGDASEVSSQSLLGFMAGRVRAGGSNSCQFGLVSTSIGDGWCACH